MTKGRKPKAAALYCRISRDTEATGLGVERQRRECEDWAESHGWVIAQTYVDNDISASNGQRRPAYRRLLADITEGRLDGLVCWHQDRLTRRPVELEELVEVVTTTEIPIGTVRSGDYDLATPSGRMVARIIGATARGEVEHMAERVSAKHRELAESGKVSGGGRRPFGYKAGGMEIEPAEAELVREACGRVLAGESLRSVVIDWNDSGIRTTTGAIFRPTTLRRILRSGRISGQREHGDRTIGAAAWPAIIDATTTLRLRAVLDDPDRPGRHVPGDSKYLLTGMLVCGGCGKPMTSRPYRGKGYLIRRYACVAERGGCNRVGIVAEPLEELVTAAVLTALDGPAMRRALARQQKPKNGAEAHLAELEAREADLGAMWARGEITKAGWSGARDQLARDLEDARARVAGRVTEDVAADYVGQGASLRKRWPGLSTERRRAVIRAALEAVTIAPTTKGNNRFDRGRVGFTWRA